MSLFNSLLAWTTNTLAPLGSLGLFILAFIESSFFPIPPDALLIVLSIDNPSKAFFFALIATIGSVLGALLGYLIGYLGEVAFLEKYVSRRKIERVHNLFNKHGSLTIFIAGFTPIPYKIFTIAAGVFYIDLKKFIVASILSRGLRFFIVAALIMFYGRAILTFIDKNFGLLSLILSIIILLVYLGFRKKKSMKQV